MYITTYLLQRAQLFISNFTIGNKLFKNPWSDCTDSILISIFDLHLVGKSKDLGH